MMSLLRSFASGTSRIGLLSDVAMVTAAALRVARKPGAGSPSAGASSSAATSSRSGRSSTRSSVPPGEWLLVAGAAFRLLRRIRAVRRSRRMRKARKGVTATTTDS